MTLDVIYNKFISSVRNRNLDIVVAIDMFITDFQRFSYSSNDIELINKSICLSRAYNNSVVYYTSGSDTDNLRDSIILIDQSDKSIFEKINLISGVTSFFFRKENNISIYENKSKSDYSPATYIKYGTFLCNIEEPYYDWVVPIIGSGKVERIIEKLLFDDAILYLNYIYYHFYGLFFPYNNQNLELIDIFSEVDMFFSNCDNKFLSDNGIKFIYRNIREVQAKTVVKKKTNC